MYTMSCRFSGGYSIVVNGDGSKGITISRSVLHDGNGAIYLAGIDKVFVRHKSVNYVNEKVIRESEQSCLTTCDEWTLPSLSIGRVHFHFKGHQE